MSLNVTDQLLSYHRAINARWRVFFQLSFCLSLIMITHESLIGASESSVPNNWDKLMHFTAYFALSFQALFAAPRMRLLPIFAGIALFGGAIEIAQDIMQLGREGTWQDGLANVIGAATPILLWCWLRRYFPAFSAS